MAALAIGLLLLSAGIGIRSGDPGRAQMAGVRIGDPAERVAQVLGKPAKPPQKLPKVAWSLGNSSATGRSSR